MLSKLKYFYIICCVVLIAFTIFSGSFARNYMENKLIHNMAESSNMNAAELFVATIWQQFRSTFSELPCKGSGCPDKDVLLVMINEFKDTKQLAALNIYSPEGDAYFANFNFYDRFGNDEVKRGFIKALHQEAESFYQADYNKRNVVRTFVPLLSPESSTSQRLRTQAIMELVYDVTDLWQYAMWIQLVVPIILISILLVLFGTTIYATRRTEKIISSQYEAASELMSAKSIAEAENEAKSKFLANVSHELRTPLNAIIGFSEIVKDEVLGPVNNKQYKDYIVDIHSSGVHLLSLINDILDFSKAEAGKLEIIKEQVDATKILKNSLRLVGTRANEAGVILEDKVPKEHVVLETDGKRLKQVILNLLSNAVKFTPEAGTVTLQSYVDEGTNRYCIEVIDTGIGIAPKDISKVMSSFGQVSNEFNRKHEGTGLGLPLSKRLIQLMGGEMQIESEENKGTQVRIILPMH